MPSPDAMLSDSPSHGPLGGNVTPRCPKPATGDVSTTACRQPPCTSDATCLSATPGYKCCFNGCVKTCTKAIAPPSGKFRDNK